MCKNGKRAHTHLVVSTFEWAHWSAHVACEPEGLRCTSNILYTVFWSMHSACTGGLNTVHVG